MTPIKKRIVKLAIVAAAGAISGWVGWNLLLNMLLGGKTFS
jgi:hypothetical protein